MKKNKTIVEFDGMVVANPYDTENYKIYGLAVDFQKYPNIKPNKYRNVGISGNLPTMENGICYRIKAEETVGKSGYEYKVINVKRDRPTNKESTRLFLREILDSYAQVEEIMREYPDIIDRVMTDRLDDIDFKKLYNIGEYRFGVIKRRILENFALAELVEEFKGIIDFKILKPLFDRYGSIEKIKEELTNEPYKCLCGLSRVAFKTADAILLSVNEECKKMIEEGKTPPINFTYDLLTSYNRQKAAIMFLLEENENNGNTRIDIKDLKNKCEGLAKKCIHHFVDVIKTEDDIYFNKESMTVSLRETYETELYIANKIINGQKVNNVWKIRNDIDYSKFDDIQLTEEQSKTVSMVCENNISILRGASGCGKSQSTKSVINMLKSNGKSFRIFAPTGRASKVIAEFTNESASTIHRGLAYMPPEWLFNENNPLCCDIVIVDETSMVDVFLMKRLIEAIDFTKTKLLMVGDPNQIPSVGAGNVFYDLINSDIIPMNTLTKVFRYGYGGILTVATEIRNCKKYLKDTKEPQVFGEDKGYLFIPTPKEKLINTVMSTYKKLLENNDKENIMILSAYNKGDYGTVNFNKNLQPLANENVKNKGKNITINGITFYEDDLIIQTVNNYKAILYSTDSFMEEKTFVPNGEIGKIVSIDYGGAVIKFDQLVYYTKEDLLNIKLAYSISIHKSQGGQCDIVILITPSSHTYSLNSNLIYVGATRAKTKVIHFGEIETVNTAIKKKADFNRNTHLKSLLKNI